MYDVAIVGGGLAGLALAIQCSNYGFSVILFEKDAYPHHKVCGEYISMESRQFLSGLGLKLSEMNLPVINKLNLSSPSGNMISSDLTPGGFGISRYKIDYELAKLATSAGGKIMDKTKVNEVTFFDDHFKITTLSSAHESKVLIGAFGKRSNLDVKMQRPFIIKKPTALNNLIGVKYHVIYNQPKDTIALHNFKDGYCGISAIEEGRYCLCYLTTSANLKRYGNSIPEMEAHILYRNPHLKQIFLNAKFIWQTPITISQVSFDRKSQVENGMLMLGDAAGMITPLCGNGMSMALQSSKIAFECIQAFLSNKIERKIMEAAYQNNWQHNFRRRLAFGRTMQSAFCKPWLTNAFFGLIKPFPILVRRLIAQSHGSSF